MRIALFTLLVAGCAHEHTQSASPPKSIPIVRVAAAATPSEGLAPRATDITTPAPITTPAVELPTPPPEPAGTFFDECTEDAPTAKKATLYPTLRAAYGGEFELETVRGKTHVSGSEYTAILTPKGVVDAHLAGHAVVLDPDYVAYWSNAECRSGCYSFEKRVGGRWVGDGALPSVYFSDYAVYRTPFGEFGTSYTGDNKEIEKAIVAPFGRPTDYPETKKLRGLPDVPEGTSFTSGPVPMSDGSVLFAASVGEERKPQIMKWTTKGITWLSLPTGDFAGEEVSKVVTQGKSITATLGNDKHTSFIRYDGSKWTRDACWTSEREGQYHADVWLGADGSLYRMYKNAVWISPADGAGKWHEFATFKPPHKDDVCSFEKSFRGTGPLAIAGSTVWATAMCGDEHYLFSSRPSARPKAVGLDPFRYMRAAQEQAELEAKRAEERERRTKR